MAGHGLRPTALRERTCRPQLKRDPLDRLPLTHALFEAGPDSLRGACRPYVGFPSHGSLGPRPMGSVATPANSREDAGLMAPLDSGKLGDGGILRPWLTKRRPNKG